MLCAESPDWFSSFYMVLKIRQDRWLAYRAQRGRQEKIQPFRSKSGCNQPFVVVVQLLSHAQLFLRPSVIPSIGVFSSESALHIRWPQYWNFSFSFSPSNEYSRLISFRIDWFDLLAVQGTLERLLSSTTVQKYQFFRVQPSLWPNPHFHT